MEILNGDSESTGILVVRGNKPTNYVMNEYGNKDTSWNEHSKKIRQVIVLKGVSLVGEKVFHICNNLMVLILSSSVRSIQRSTFDITPV